MKVLETERLILRRFQLTDLHDFFEYCQLETVGPNAGWRPHKTVEESFAILREFSIREDILALVLKENSKVIGSIGIHKKETESGTYYELGYVMSTLYEGKGLMTETVKRVLRYFFFELEHEEIYVSHFIENIKSEKVILKTGFEFIGNTVTKTSDFGQKKSKRYKLTKENYIKMMEEQNEKVES